MSIWKDFRDFAFKGNMIDLAVGVIIGGAFGGVVKSLVDDVIMPPIGMAAGHTDFSNYFAVLTDGKTAGPYTTVAAAKAAGATVLSYGAFGNTLINFLIIAAAVFAIVRMVQRVQPPKAAGPTEVELLTQIRDLLKKVEPAKEPEKATSTEPASAKK